MVQPAKVAHVLRRKRDVPTTAGSASGTGRLDEEVAHATDRVGCDGSS